MEFLDVVKARHSIRSYCGEEVSEAQIAQIIECARLAPSWANKQCWSFIVVRDGGKIKSLAKAAGMSNRWIGDAPVIIVCCADPKSSGTRSGIAYFTVDAAIAMEHLILAAAEQGLGTCWIGYFDEDGVKKALDIPDGMRVVAMTPVGHPADRMTLRERITKWITKSKNRKSMDEILHQDTW